MTDTEARWGQPLQADTRVNFPSTTGQEKDKTSREQVELIVVSAGHQIFGLLMSQVFNIVRPGPGGLQLLVPAQSEKELPYGEVLYQNSSLRVVELSRQLLLPLVEPIERSKILLTGQLQSNGRIKSQFGVAVDDIVTLRRVKLSDLCILPPWLCASQLGKLIWGAVLVEPQALTQDKTNLDYQNSALPQPFQLAAEARPAELAITERRGSSSLNSVPISNSKNSLNLAERLAQREKKVEQITVDNRRPLLLLDLHLLQSQAFPEEA